ncbi:Nn.00g095340.m01.CDS01 [Neocucurbitaria sp. VM-36]
MSRSRLTPHHNPFKGSCHRTRQPFRPFNAPPSPRNPILQSRIRWSYLWYASILALGITTGLGARHFAAPLGLPSPGSREDELILESLSRDIDTLEIVQSLRKQTYNLHSDTALKSGPGLGTGGGGRKISAYKGWLELDVDFGKDEDSKEGILGVMSGTRGLGVQRAFWNAESKEMVAVVWMGGGLSGWPGVAHGGAIATVFEEVMARMVRGPEGSVEAIHRPNCLSVTYAKPTYSLDFYILRASFSKPDLPQTEPSPEPESQPTKSWLSWLSPKKDMTKKEEPGQNMVSEIVGTLENVKGDLCVKAKGTFGTHAPLK